MESLKYMIKFFPVVGWSVWCCFGKLCVKAVWPLTHCFTAVGRLVLMNSADKSRLKQVKVTCITALYYDTTVVVTGCMQVRVQKISSSLHFQ